MTEFFPTLFTDMVGKNSVHQNDRQGWKKKRTSHCQEGAPVLPAMIKSRRAVVCSGPR